MRINSTELSLSLALHSLKTTVLPDATSDAAQKAIANITLALTDLLKRQGPGISFLEDHIRDGLRVCEKIEKIVDINSAGPIRTEPGQSFDALVIKHDVLTQKLNQLCIELLNTKYPHPQGGTALRQAAEWEQKYYVGLAQLSARPFGEDPTENPPSDPPLSPEFLEEFLRSQRGDSGICVKHFEAVPGGYGNQTFFCTVSTQEGGASKEESIVVRKSDGVPIVLPLEQEYDLLRVLATTDYPVAKPLELASRLPGVDGSFFTMSRLSGRMIGSYIEGKKVNVSEKLLLRLAELLGKLHSMPLEIFREYITTYNETSVFDENVKQRHQNKLAYWKKYSQEAAHPPSPFVTWLFDWCENNVPADTRSPVLTHGDYNVHNILTEDGEVTGILDWECSDFGAPEMDLAYLQPTVAAHMDWDLFLEHYYAHGGSKVNPACMLYCAVYSGLRLALAAGRFAISLQNGINRDIRFINVEHGLMAAIMAMGLDVTKAAKDAVQAGGKKTEAKRSSVIVETAHVEVA